jgi:hypothetical protein
MLWLLVFCEKMSWLLTGSTEGTRSALVATLSHFPELEAEVELLGSG